MDAVHSPDNREPSPEARAEAPAEASATAMIRVPGSLTPPRGINVEDLRRRARRRLPRVVFNYVDGGADDEVTLRENCSAFQDVTFRPRQAVALPGYDLRARVLG